MKKVFSLLVLCVINYYSSFAQFSILKDIVVGNKNGISNEIHLVKFKDYLYFTNVTGNLFRTDGTDLGTNKSQASPFGLGIKKVAVGKNKLFFNASNFSLNVSNGVSDDYQTLAIGEFQDFYYVNSDNFIISSPSMPNKAKIWKTNGTAASTTSEVEIPYKSGFMKGSIYKDRVVLIEKSTNVTQLEPMISDGTTTNTISVKDYIKKFVDCSSVKGAVGIGNYLIVDGIFGGFSESYITDGTANGTKKISSIFGTPSGSYFVNGKWIIFTDGYLYVFNDVTKDIESIFYNVGYFTNPFVSNNKLYFHSDDGYIFTSDGTVSGTKKVSSSTKGSFNYEPKIWVEGDSLFYTIRSSSDEQWQVVNLKTGKDTLFTSTGAGTNLNYIPAIGKINNTYVFPKYDANYGYELWKYDAITIAPLAAAITQAGTIKCNGDKIDLKATATGGTLPFKYLWNNGATTESITSIGAGVHSVTVTSNDKQNSITSVTLIEPTKIVVTTTTKDANPQFKNGNAVAAVTGGTVPYTYAWNTNPAQATATAIGLLPGNYIVTVTDANSCKTTATTTVGTSTSTNSAWEKYSFTAFPNPATDILTISFNGLAVQKVDILLMDALGKIVLTQTFDNNRFNLNVAEIPQGIYTLKCNIGQEEANTTILIQ